MSSVIFQPLLHDPLGWKTSNTTYTDTFKWIKHRSTSKDKKISPYGQRYQRELKKQQQEEQQKQQQLQQTNGLLSTPADGEQIIQRVGSTKKTEEHRDLTHKVNRCLSSKSAPAFIDETVVSSTDFKVRSGSNMREATCGSRASQRSLTAPPAAEEICRSTTSLDMRRSSKEEKDKVIVDANNDNSRHWLTYPNPKTPQYLIDIKQRLGQLKVPATLARPTSATNLSAEQPQQRPSPLLQRSETTISQRPHQPPTADQRHFLDFNTPPTPTDLRAARHRIDKHRYNPSLDDFPTRPQTCPVQTQEAPKPPTPPVVFVAPIIETKDETLSITETTQIKNDAWTNEEEFKPDEHEQSTILIQPADIEGLPKEYIEAVETATKVQEDYLKCSNTNDEKKSEHCTYRLPAMQSDIKSESFTAFRHQQRSVTPNLNSTRANEFNTWVRQATYRERESAMKILQDVLNQPIMGYDIPTKPKTVFKQPPVPPPVRASSGTRKLGRTRTHQRLPCEICEKQLLKHHVWNLSRSDTLTCPHETQTIKTPVVPVPAS